MSLLRCFAVLSLALASACTALKEAPPPVMQQSAPLMVDPALIGQPRTSTR